MKTYLRSICISMGIAALGCSTVFAYNNATSRSVILYLDELPQMVTTEASTIGELMEEMHIPEPEYRLDRSMTKDQLVEDMMEIQLLSYVEKVTATTVTKPYTTIKKEVDHLPEGVTNIVQKGVVGKIVKYEDCVYYGEEMIYSQMKSQSVIQQPVDEIIEIGIKPAEIIETHGIDDVVVEVSSDVETPLVTPVAPVAPESANDIVTEVTEIISDDSLIKYSDMSEELMKVYQSLNKSEVDGERVVFQSMQSKVTAYTPFDPGCNGITYTGTVAKEGVIAVDPSIIPLGSKVYVPGYGVAIAEDIGGAIKNNRLDVCFESRSRALEWGVKDLTVYIIVD